MQSSFLIAQQKMSKFLKSSKFHFNELVSTCKNTFLAIEKVTHPPFQKFFFWMVGLGPENILVKNFHLHFINVDLTAKKPIFFLKNQFLAIQTKRQAKKNLKGCISMYLSISWGVFEVTFCRKMTPYRVSDTLKCPKMIEIQQK